MLSTRLSDRVTHWLTINEPNMFWAFGSEAGIMPPEQKRADAELVLGAHNILLGHGKSVQAIRAAAKRPVEISLAFAGLISLPASDSPNDIAAARTASFRVKKSKIAPICHR
jgi:beta-glucosidase